MENLLFNRQVQLVLGIHGCLGKKKKKKSSSRFSWSADVGLGHPVPPKHRLETIHLLGD